MSKQTIELTELTPLWAGKLDETYDQGLASLRTSDGKHLLTGIDASQVRAVELATLLTEKKAMLHMAVQERRDQDATVEQLRRDLNKAKKANNRLKKRNKELTASIKALTRKITPGIPPGHGSAHL